MASNIGQLIIGLNGSIVDKINGYITATSQFTNYIQVVAPFPDNDSVSINFYLRNARISDYTQYMTLQRDDSNVPLKGRDVVSSSKEYYQAIKDWNVWLVPIEDLALAAISKWHSGTVNVSVTFRSFRNLSIEETGTYIGTFGSRKSITKGDLPLTATEGDFYRCDYLDYYSDVSNLEYTLGDLAIYTNGEWIKGNAYETRLTSSSTEFGVDAAIFGQRIESIRLDTTEMIIDRIAGLEAAILTGDGGGSYADNLYIRNGLDLNYEDETQPVPTDVIYLERGVDGKNVKIQDLVKGLPELDAEVLRTPNAVSPYDDSGFYASDDVILIGSATGPGISWDGTNLYLRGTIQSGTITDPALLEELKGDPGQDGADGADGQDGYTPILGVDYFNGSDGLPFRFVGTLPLLSSLSLISNPSRNDSYRITETEELWTWTGTQWRNMGVIRGLPGTDGTNGLSSYLHIAYATNITGTAGFSLTTAVGKTHIGTYRDFIASDSTDPTKYKWALMKGVDGVNGTDGTNGISAYLHVAYATNSTGTSGFSITDSVNKTYIGTYTNAIATDSTDPADYKWTLIKGADGANGTDGTNGISSYLHTAYANSADGWRDFANSYPVGSQRSYIGIYTDSYPVSSVNPDDYDWTLMKGSDGADGTDGADGINSYLHIAYANSANGATDFSTTVSTGKTYIGVYTNSIEADSEVYTSYTWSLIKGADGANGTDGTDGISAYLHIAYANSADGSDGFATYVVPGTYKYYIGTYTNSNPVSSVVPSDYNWTLVRGADGADGSDGVDGTSAYLHIAYATAADGSTGFSTTDSVNKTYIGQYTNTIATDSTNPADYSWTKIVGPAGIDGTNGLQYYLHIAYAANSTGTLNFSTTDPTNKNYIGTYTDTNPTDSGSPSVYTWALFKGADGLDGADGTSVVLKGSVDTTGDLPTGADVGDLYIVLADGNGYVWNGSSWTNAGPIQGPAGEDGADGLNAYVHFAYATSANGQTGFSTTPFTGALYIGTYSDFILADSTLYSDYKWSLFKGADGIDGADGTNGLSAYIHYAYSTSANGQTNFSTTWFSGATYVGWYTDFTVADSNTYTDYEWSLFKGADGLDGADGSNGLSAYIHYAYSTSANGQTNFSTTWFSGANYVGWYTDFTEADSQDYLDYEWSLFKGADGANGIDGTNGLPSYVHYAYSSSSNGQTDFNTSWFSGATYVGWYTDFTEADSTLYSDYEWSLFKGSDGIDGTDGTNGISAYIHYAYATSADGSTGFSTVYTGTEQYVGWYTDATEADSNNYLDYEWSLFKGADGANGTDGTNGLPSYVHYAYATSNNGDSGFSTTWFSGATYIGWYTDFIEADSPYFFHYEWSLFKGSDGLDGQDGENGLPSYVHYAYATNSTGSAGFSLTYTGVESYIGWYSDFTEADSNNYTDYEWSLFRGADGADGQDAEPSKLVQITGKNSYKFLKDQTVPTYTTITLTATSFNLVVNELIWYYSNDDGATWIITGTTGSKYVNAYDNAMWGTRTSLMFKCTDPTDIYYDIFSIYKLYDGATGINAVNGYLTDENRSFATNSIGQGYNTTGFSGTFKVFYGLTDVTTSSTFSITSTNPSNGMTLSIGASTGIYTLETDDNTWTGDSASWTLRAIYGTVTLTKVFKITKAKAGTNGSDGPAGPGLVFRGAFSSSSIYYSTDIRKDVVLYSSNYYSLKPAYNNATGAWVASEWDLMTGFTSVATDLLLAQNATINKGLVLGSSSSDTTAFIRTFDMSSLTSGTGFYIDGTGKMRLGDVTGDNLYWNGTSLAIKGDITADNLTINNDLTVTNDIILGTGGELHTLNKDSLTDTTPGVFIQSDGKFIFGNYSGHRITWDGSNMKVIDKLYDMELDEDNRTVVLTNNTTSNETAYYKIWTTTEPSTWTTGPTVAANSTATISSSGWVDAIRYYVKVRFGLTDTWNITKRFLNVSSNVYKGFADVFSSISGGTLVTASQVFIPILDDSYLERYAVYISGIVTVSSAAGTATLTLAEPIGDLVVTTGVKSADSSGSGGDFVYANGYNTGSPFTGIITLTHDYTTNTNSRTIAFIASGYYMGGL